MHNGWKYLRLFVLVSCLMLGCDDGKTSKQNNSYNNKNNTNNTNNINNINNPTNNANNANNWSAACPDAVVQAIFACVEDGEADPEYDPYRVSRMDLAETCTDAEVVAGAWDGWCAQHPQDPVCTMGFEAFAVQVLPDCGRVVLDAVWDEACVFGVSWRSLWDRPGPVVVVAQEVLTADSNLSPLEEEQIVAAVKASAWDDVTTAQEAFDVVDGGEINRVELWDASSRRAFAGYEFGAGDNSYGMIFAWGTTQAAARIGDGDIYDCTAFWGNERRHCRENADCREDLECAGIAGEIHRGACLDPSAVEHPAKDASCSEWSPCPDGSGLACISGTCQPAWMQGRFAISPSMGIPDGDAGGVAVQLPAYGLASHAAAVSVDLYIAHPRPSDLFVALVNPSGQTVTLFDREANEIFVRDRAVQGFGGSGPANGIWELRVVDTVSGTAGSVEYFALTIQSLP